GLVNDRKQGRWNYYSLKPDVLDVIAAYLQERKPDPEGWSTCACDEPHEGACCCAADFLRRYRSTFLDRWVGMSDVREIVRERYGQAALRVVQEQTKASCCGTGGSCGTADPITRDLYDAVTTAALPQAAVLASLGCGNPTALAELKEGDVVLDLGSGGGIDVLLSAKRVGPTGKAYGLDMTDELLALARRNAAEVGATNVEFLKGHIETIPLPDASVDVILSNCVINLSADKRQVLKEA